MKNVFFKKKKHDTGLKLAAYFQKWSFPEGDNSLDYVSLCMKELGVGRWAEN